ADHVWGVLATGRPDGSPQQSMVGYVLGEAGRILVLTQAVTAMWRNGVRALTQAVMEKWLNAMRQPRVAFTVPDGRVHVVVYGVAEGIDVDPERAELSADVLSCVRRTKWPDA